MKNKFFLQKSTALLVIYTIFALIFFNMFVNPYLQGENELKWAADSLTYLNMASYIDEYTSLVQIGANALGPVMIARLFGNNNFLIAIFNYLLFIFSYWILINTFKVDRLNLLLLFLATPMLFVSILTLNKEILGFFVVSMFTCAIQKNKNRFLIFLILFFSIFVRWQLFFTMFLFLIFQKFSSGYIRRIVILASIIMIISLVYPIFHNFFDVQSILNLDMNISEQTTKSGFIILLNDLQNRYMFFLAVIPKIMYNLFADANKIYFSITELNTLDYTDIYNNFIIPLHCVVMVFIVLNLANQKKLDVLSNNIYLFLFYSIIFSLSPYVQPRYFFPIYPLLCLEISKRKKYE